MQSPREPGFDNARVWLKMHEAELAEIEELSRTRRFLFGIQRSGDAALAFYDLPEGVGEAVRVCQALVARALYHYNNADHESAIASLDAACSVALDVGDGRLLHHKALSVASRSHTYDALLTILNDAGSDRVAARAYINWALRDPPLAPYRSAMTSGRQKLAQFCEGAAFAKGARGSGYLDLNVLDRLADGFYSNIGQRTMEDRAFARLLTPDEALAAIDAFVREVEQWDSLPFSELNARAGQLVSELQSNPAWKVVGAHVRQYRSAFQARQRIVAERAGMLLAAYLCRYRADHGHWPETLGEALPENARVDTTDPYMGCAFGYRLLDGRPLLYSLNEDGNDDGGRPGDWGDLRTDVVFFRLRVR